MMQTETTISNAGPLLSAEVIQVIRTTVFRGKGTDEDVMRHATQYWSLDGQLLAEVDKYPPAVIFTHTVVTQEDSE